MRIGHRTPIWRDVRLLAPQDRWTRFHIMALMVTCRIQPRRRRTRAESPPVGDRASLRGKEHGAIRPMHRRDSRRTRGALVATVLSASMLPLSMSGQTTVTTPYRAPTIALVQPAAGGSVPRDRPVVVFRFARGEADDPVDVRTFAVTMDGVDRSAQFQVTADEAWGALMPNANADSLIALGTHAVSARVCSVRGACTETTNSITAAEPSAVSSAPGPAEPKSNRKRVVELLLDALRKLITP